MPETPPPAASPPAALLAFLRGVERRAALLAELQTGDAEVGDLAVATAMRQFQEQAAILPMADWPRRFWQRLTASTAHRTATPGRWPVGLSHLATLAPADRLVLLSRLAAGLPEDEAVEVLAIDLTHYRAALAAACPRDADGAPDAPAWRYLADAIQTHGRELPAERMARLARLREHALHPPPPRAPATAAAPTAGAPADAARAPGSRWKKLWLILVVLLCCLALAATFLPGQWWSRMGMLSGGTHATGAPAGPGLAEEPVIQVQALPAAESPAATWPADAAIASHPDLAMLRDPHFALAQQADFYAWYLAGAADGNASEATATPADADANLQEEGRDTTF